jgi:hypothetical protein
MCAGGVCGVEAHMPVRSPSTGVEGVGGNLKVGS